MKLYETHSHRGDQLLLTHCTASAEDRPPAFRRLEEQLGGDFARVLVATLAGAQDRCGPSSP